MQILTPEEVFARQKAHEGGRQRRRASGGEKQKKVPAYLRPAFSLLLCLVKGRGTCVGVIR